MKKFLLIFTMICLLLLCSCRRLNQPDDIYYSNNNSSDISSNFSFVTSDFSSTTSDTTTTNLPERDDPTSSSENTSSQDIVTSYGELDNSIENNVDISTISIETTDIYYSNMSNSISFTIFNSRKKSFTYFTDFFLQKYENGDWEYVETKDRNINYKFETTISTSSVEIISLKIKDLYNAPLLTGNYRIIQESDYGTLVSNEFVIVEEDFFTNE